MDCLRAEERMSDHLDGTLEASLRVEFERHLSSCQSCRALREDVGAIKTLLGTLSWPEPSAALAERAARAGLRAGRPTVRPSFGWLRTAAAGLALVGLGGVLFVTGPEPSSRAAGRIVDRGTNAGLRLLDRKDRLVEDLRVLKVVISTAFEARVEGMSDRVEDYRRLLERRRRMGNEKDAPASSPAGHESSPSRPSSLQREPGPALAHRVFELEALGTRSIVRRS